MKTLFVCRSNVARSQIAEGWYNQITKSREGFSAGTAAHDFVEIPHDIKYTMLAYGLDLSEAKPKQVTSKMARVAGRIILMTDFEVPNFLLSNPKVKFWDIPDPRYGGVEDLINTSKTLKLMIQEQLL